MNWYIGQKIVCIRTPKSLLFNEGDMFKITGVRESTCKCPYIELSIGIAATNNFLSCSKCNTYAILNTSSEAWFCSTIFRPPESTYTEEEIEAVNIDELVQPELEPA